MLILIQGNLHIATCVSCFIPAENTRSFCRVGTFSVGNLLSKEYRWQYDDIYGILIRCSAYSALQYVCAKNDCIQFDLSGPSAFEYFYENNYCIPDMTF